MARLTGTTLGAAAFILAASIAGVAHAQTATEQDCATALEALNAATTAEQGPTSTARQEAERISEEASNAQDAGDYARCVELAQQAMDAMNPQ